MYQFHLLSDIWLTLQIIEITSDNSLKNLMLSDKIRIFSLPTKGLDISVQAVFKAEMRSSELTLSFPDSGPSIIAKVEDFFIDFGFFRREIPQNLTVTSYAYSMDLCQIRVQGQCLLLSCNDVDTPNYYRWEALSKLMQYYILIIFNFFKLLIIFFWSTNGTVLIAKEHNTFSNYVLTPCKFCFLLCLSFVRLTRIFRQQPPNSNATDGL